MRHEYGEWLWIEDGISAGDQESSFMNATLQDVADYDLSFSVATHIGIPADVTDEERLRNYLAMILQRVTDLGLGIAFEVQLGPTYDE